MKARIRGLKGEKRRLEPDLGRSHGAGCVLRALHWVGSRIAVRELEGVIQPRQGRGLSWSKGVQIEDSILNWKSLKTKEIHIR